VQALVRWDPAGHAEQELAARTELGFPPAIRMASVDASPSALADFLDHLELPASGEILGPVPLGDKGDLERALIRSSLADGRALATTLAIAQAARTARKDPEALKVRVDPLDMV
jgi:primosomal protein N' (replication factor Y)